ncbi:MAG TPA: rhomboid family intramembrane serine protease [Vicinamibacterales bacterium]|nr:rhomboid family intramembrane serine protease [Vicinamibacterales bacterium]
MIPVQDVVPSGRPPLATLVLVALNALAFAAPALAGQVPPALAALFGDTTLVNVVVSMWFLWLFGDNVEARIGRLTAIVIYVSCGWLALHLSLAPGSPPMAGIGTAGGITGILGAYFLLLPRSRVLMLMPAPVTLVEVPALFFLGCWWVLQLLRFVVAPAAARVLTDGAAIWALGAAMLLGAVVCRLTRRPVIWQ